MRVIDTSIRVALLAAGRLRDGSSPRKWFVDKGIREGSVVGQGGRLLHRSNEWSSWANERPPGAGNGRGQSRRSVLRRIRAWERLTDSSWPFAMIAT